MLLNLSSWVRLSFQLMHPLKFSILTSTDLTAGYVYGSVTEPQHFGSGIRSGTITGTFVKLKLMRENPSYLFID